MRNIKIIVKYDGTRYAGWQKLGKQNIKEITIQEILEQTLSKVCQEFDPKGKIKHYEMIGSGRTDAGVHAIGQVANFFMPSVFGLKEIQKEWNQKLPEDIRILQMEEVSDKFHSRYSAVSKEYSYFIDTRECPNVFYRKYALWVPQKLEIERMKQAIGLLQGRHDFRGFASKMKDGRNTVKNIYEIRLIERPKNLLEIAYHGDGFLYHMVRILTGTLLEVGMGEKNLKDIEKCLLEGNRQYAGKTVSGHGLFLKQVNYSKTTGRD